MYFQLQVELQRLEVLKMHSMKSVTEAIRAEIALLWERCFYSKEQQQAFAPYHDGECPFFKDNTLKLNIHSKCHKSLCALHPTDDFTEDLLNLHEAEVKTLKKYYEDHKELFEGVTKWQNNWTLYLELDVSTVLMSSVSKPSKQISLGLLTHVDVFTLITEKGK